MPVNRLGSWKEIAQYLGRSVKTCQRWEQTFELPVHRLEGAPRSRVFADQTELDIWTRSKLHLADASGVSPGDAWPATVEPAISSLAVLPLRNLSGRSEHEYFADGLTEVLITELGALGALRVISHQSVRQFKDNVTPLSEIARLLDVDAFVEGTVLDCAKRVRLTVNLVRASPEGHVWAETYTCFKKDLARVPRQIAHEVARHARIRLTPEQRARLLGRTAVEPLAYELFLKAKAAVRHSFVQSELEQALHYLEKALAVDPNFAAALAELAWCHGQLAFHSLVPPGEGFARQKAAAERALAIDPGLAEAHAAMGMAAFALDWDWRRAGRHFDRALELNPSSVRARQLRLYYVGCMGRLEEAARGHAALMQLDPLDAENLWNHAWSHFWSRRYDRATAVFEKLLGMSPDDPYLRMALAMALLFSGAPADALQNANRARSGIPTGRDQQFDMFVAYVQARAGEHRRAKEMLDRWFAMENERYVNPVLFAPVYAALGNADEVFRRLEAGYRQRSNTLVWVLMVSPFFDALTNDPRHTHLMRRLKLPAA